MATEIYQIPSEGGSGNNGSLPFTIPIGNNGGLFGNGNNSLADLFGFAIIASMFGWNNGGWGNGGFGGGNNGAGFLANQINNDSGRELIMNAINSNGEASRSAIQNLATMLGQDYATDYDELFNTINHEISHATDHLCEVYGYPTHGEKSAYVNGEISKKMYKAVALSICPKCNCGEKLHYRRL